MVKQPAVDDLGESVEGPSKSVREESDGTGRAGDAVTYNASGQVTPVTAADDDIIGILYEDAPDAGDLVNVQDSGIVAARAAAAVTKGDVLDPDGTAAGELAPNAQGTSHQVDEGGTGTYRLSPVNPQARSDAGAGEPVAVKLR